MGQAEYAEKLTENVSGWLKDGADWAAGVVQNGSQSMGGGMGALDWFAKNWIILLVTLIVIGLVVDWLVWMIRWRPYRLWFGGRKRPEERLRRRYEDEDNFEDARPRRARRPHFEGSALKQAEEDPLEDEFELDEDDFDGDDFESDDAFEPVEEAFEDFEDFEDEDEAEESRPLSRPVVSKPKLGLFARKNAQRADAEENGGADEDEFEDFEDFDEFDEGQTADISNQSAVSDEPEDDLFDFEDDFADDSDDFQTEPSKDVQVHPIQSAEAWHTGYTTSIPVVSAQQDEEDVSRKARRTHRK